jgi:N-acyl-phosphatidylethanolamine-hydrolysing phospholipase D
VNNYLGPRRLRPTPCQLSDLHVDIVLVSHNHFDHLDERVVFALNNTVRWVVPLGLRDWFARRGVYKVIELDWWQEHTFQGNSSFTVTATPLQVSTKLIIILN